MSEKRENRDPRWDFFRPVAVERYERPIEIDGPEQLAPWRPGLVVAAALAACVIGTILLAG